MYRGVNLGSGVAARYVLRFGQKLRGEDVPSVPARYRTGPGGPSGTLVALRLRPATGEAWLRLRASGMPWRRAIRTLPLGTAQSPAPTPDSLELRGGMHVRCHDGTIGRLRGAALDQGSGLVTDLLARVRENVLADMRSSVSPMGALLAVAGREVLLSPAWAVSTTREQGFVPGVGVTSLVLLNASAEQVASAVVFRPDGTVAAAIASLWDDNPAIAPFTHQIEAAVRDGDVVLRGTLPSPRHRATAEQDVWHVPGVLAVHNRIVSRG